MQVVWQACKMLAILTLFNRRTSQSQKETHSVLPYAVYVVQQ